MSATTASSDYPASQVSPGVNNATIVFLARIVDEKYGFVGFGSPAAGQTSQWAMTRCDESMDTLTDAARSVVDQSGAETDLWKTKIQEKLKSVMSERSEKEISANFAIEVRTFDSLGELADAVAAHEVNLARIKAGGAFEGDLITVEERCAALAVKLNKVYSSAPNSNEEIIVNLLE